MPEYSLSIDASVRETAPFDLFPSILGDDDCFEDLDPETEAAIQAAMIRTCEREISPFERAIRAYDRELEAMRYGQR